LFEVPAVATFIVCSGLARWADGGGHVTWSLDHAYDAFPRVEERFQALLDESLEPYGPDVLFDLMAEFDLEPGAVVVDVGCGEGGHAVELAERFGFAVTGVDPVARHIGIARAAAADTGPRFVHGTAEQIPFDDASVAAIWCRDVLVHVADLPAAFVEFRRVLRPGGRALVYQMFGTELLEAQEAARLWDVMGVVPSSVDPANTHTAIAAAGLVVDRCIDLGTQWGEWAQEQQGKPGRKLLHAARLLRARDRYIEQFGQASYDMMLGDCLWHVYAMIGKLTRRVYLLSAPT
jgi:ubiquinone/menaquinone biosynthesis C-methylase UbiE